jgi:hypothetical protein
MGPGHLKRELSPPALLLASITSQQGKIAAKAEGPCAYLDVSSAQALLSTPQHLPRGQSAAGRRCTSPSPQQRRAQTASCGQGREDDDPAAASRIRAGSAEQPTAGQLVPGGSSSAGPPRRRPRLVNLIIHGMISTQLVLHEQRQDGRDGWRVLHTYTRTEKRSRCLTLQRSSMCLLRFVCCCCSSTTCYACRHRAFRPTCDMPAVRGPCHDCCSKTALCPNCVLQMEQQREPSNRSQFHRGAAAVAARPGARGIFPKAPRQHHSSQQW